MKARYLCWLIGCMAFYKPWAQTWPAYMVNVDSKGLPGYYFFTPITKKDSSRIPLSGQMILDGSGGLVYFKNVPVNSFTADLKLSHGGRMSYGCNTGFYFMNGDFEVVDSVFCQNRRKDDNHEMQMLANGHVLLLGKESIEMDLSCYHEFQHKGAGGSKHAQVISGIIQELDENKQLVFEWHAKDYFDFDDVDTSYLNNPAQVDWTHFNALEMDADGNILVSSKNFNEITKINRRDSSVMWRMGGKRNQFIFTNDPQAFKQQHDIRRLPNGHITLFDNGNDRIPFHAAAAKEYVVDEKNHSVTLVWSYVQDSTAFSDGGGGVQRLPDGNTLVAYGRLINSKVPFTLVDATGKKLFETTFESEVATYRAYFYSALPFKLKRPVVSCTCTGEKCFLTADATFKDYTWTTGETTRRITVTAPGTYFVYAPVSNGGYICSIPVVIKNMNEGCIAH